MENFVKQELTAPEDESRIKIYYSNKQFCL